MERSLQMEYINLLVETFLDSVSMFLLCNYLSYRNIDKNNKNKLWIVFTTIIYIISRLGISIGENEFISTIEFKGFEILPVGSIMGTVLLCIFLMIANNIFLKVQDKQAFFSTIAAIIIWIFIRTITIFALSWINGYSFILYEYGYRIMTLGIIFLIVIKVPLYRFKEFLVKDSNITKVILLNSFIILIILVWSFNFDINRLMENTVLVIIIFFTLFIINLWVAISQRKVIQREKRIEVMEKYLPVIDDLMSEVKGRQHEFNNKLLAIYSILDTSEDLDEARDKIYKYGSSVLLSSNINELFICDSKVISGFLYSKIKFARLKNIRVDIKITASFRNICTEEYEIVEILGILIDNAVEASEGRDNIIVTIKKENNLLEIMVYNKYSVISNGEFMKIFEKGYSTKSNDLRGRGYGLYNVKEIVEGVNGKIIFKNTIIDNENHVCIGVLLP